MERPPDAPTPAKTGIAELDDVLGGGFVRDRVYLLEGSPGSGKTTVALQFLLEGAAREEATDRFLKRHFSPWAPDFPLPDAAKTRKGWQDLAGSEGLGENRRPVPASLRRSWLEAACAAPFGEENRCGVVLLPADLRLLPTSRALFEPLTRDGGGGYPFDQLQNSTLKPGEAVRLLHRTPDGAWAFVAA